MKDINETDKDNFIRYLQFYNNGVNCELWSPPRSNDQLENRIKYLRIGLMDVRASDGIRVSYDFDRDGWIIEQPYYRLEESKEDCCLTQICYYKETAFLKSWKLNDLSDDDCKLT